MFQKEIFETMTIVSMDFFWLWDHRWPWWHVTLPITCYKNQQETIDKSETGHGLHVPLTFPSVCLNIALNVTLNL